jgi:hypothetical protein
VAVLADVPPPGAVTAASAPEGGKQKMKTIKSIIFVLCLLSVCSKVSFHTYRHFHPAAVAAVAP